MNELVLQLSAGFLSYLRNGLVAAAFLAVILIFRRVTKKLPKIYVCLLWTCFLVQLLLPPIFASPVSWMPDWRTLAESWQMSAEHWASPQDGASGEREPVLSPEPGAFWEASNGGLQEPSWNPGLQDAAPIQPDAQGKAESGTFGSGKVQGGVQRDQGISKVLAVCTCVWLMGAWVTGTGFLVSWVRWKRRLRTAVRVEKNVYESGEISLPFVLPGLPPRIYLPAGLEEDRRRDILAHEKMHIRHGDPGVKILSVLALMLHWYNPLVWKSMGLRDKDMEMFCDEGVLRRKSLKEKKHYSETLLAFSVKEKGMEPLLSFGESNTESRIRHILYSHKPGVVISGVLVLVILGLSLSFLTARAGKTPEEGQTAPEGQKTPEEGQGMPEDGGQAAPEGQGTPEEEQESGTEPEDEGAPAEPSLLVGEEYVPEGGVAAQLLSGVSDYSDNYLWNRDDPDYDYRKDWNDRPRWAEGMSEEETKKLQEQIFLIGVSQGFRLYGDGDDTYMLVETPEGKYVHIDMPYTSNYDIQPRILEADFDGDEEEELAINLCIFHGTGVYVEFLLMVDRDEEGIWRAYHLNMDWYETELAKHYTTRQNSGVNQDGLGGIVPEIDGREVGFCMGVEDQAASKGYSYYAGNHIRYTFRDLRDKPAFAEGDELQIWMEAELGAYSEECVSGEYFANGIKALVLYRGDGVWELGECRYYAPSLEEKVTLEWEENRRQPDGGKYRVVDISYEDTTLETQPVSVQVTLMAEGSDSPVYGEMELTCWKDGNGRNDYYLWNVDRAELVPSR